jgi:hypothetical protein
MFEIPKLYSSACSYAVQTVRIYPILMYILFHHYKQLTECISRVEQMEARVKRQGPLIPLPQPPQEEQMNEEEQQQEEGEEYATNTGTLDRYFIKNRIDESW